MDKFITILPIFPEELQKKLTFFSESPERQFINNILKRGNTIDLNKKVIGVILEGLLDIVPDLVVRNKIVDVMCEINKGKGKEII